MFFKYLQRLGKALMMPVSVLPAAGMLVGIGRLLMNREQIWVKIGKVMFNGGLSIFDNLPLIFAIGVAIGFSREMVSALAAGVGYTVYKRVLGVMSNLIKLTGENGGGIQEINTGVFGGIIIGILAAYSYKRFYDTNLPAYLGFFSGKRLVPIITTIFSLLLAVVLSFIWPVIQIWINKFARFAMQSSLGPAFYAAGKRALIPVGLHHVYYPPFLYEFGRYTTEAGRVLRGGTARYFAGDPSAGYFMASEFPLMLFGLPAACIAMYLRAKPRRKKEIAGIMTTAALTSFLTGITEPIEFSFVFVAPLLYVFHVVGGFLSGLLTKLFNIRLGYTFTASIIDYFLGISNAGNAWLLWGIVGPIIGVLYFTVFYVAIPAFDLKTPGREEIELDSQKAEEKEQNNEQEINNQSRPALVVKALGGKENIESIESCITRLWVEVKNNAKVNEDKLKELGASGVMKWGEGVQVMFGPETSVLKDKIDKLL